MILIAICIWRLNIQLEREPTMTILDKILNKWDWLLTAFLISVALIILVLDIFSSMIDIDTDIILSLVIIILSPIPLVMGKVLHQTDELKMIICDLEEPEVGKVLKKFDDIKEDIKRDMERAGRIRILSRTGQRWHKNLLKSILKAQYKKVQMLCLNPTEGEDQAFQMYLSQKHGLKSKNIKKEERDNHCEFLKNIGAEIEIKVINYLPPYSIVIIDFPNKCSRDSISNDAILYIELASFNSPYYGKPVFKVARPGSLCFKFFFKRI